MDQAMDEAMDDVPKRVKLATEILQLAQEEGQSVTHLINKFLCEGKLSNENLVATRSLVVSSINHEYLLSRLLDETDILKKSSMDPWLARILITQLFWVKSEFSSGSCLPLYVVQSYEQRFREILGKDVKIAIDGDGPNYRRDWRRPRYALVNTLLIPVKKAIRELCNEGWKQVTLASADYEQYVNKLISLEEDQFMQDLHMRRLLVFPSTANFGRCALYRNGSIIIQDKANCFGPTLLNPTPGSTVLNMCAAPGHKALHLAVIMKNKGTLYAVERHGERYENMCKFITMHGANCVTMICFDSTKLTPDECEKVEYILVDPSCSGSGENHLNISPAKLSFLADAQVFILKKALTTFPDVKRVVYSTCSIYAEENEEVVERVLDVVNANTQRFKIADDTLPSWAYRGLDRFEFGNHCLASNPDSTHSLTTGFFLAVLERVDLEDKEDVISGLAAFQKNSVTHERKNKEMPAVEKTNKRKKVVEIECEQELESDEYTNNCSKESGVKRKKGLVEKKDKVKRVVNMMEMKDGHMKARKIKKKKKKQKLSN